MERWVIAYDVPDDHRRAKLARILDDFGDRAQWSVFEIHTDPKNLDILRHKILQTIDPAQDAVRMYPLCIACSPKVVVLGIVTRKPFDRPDLIIL